MKKVYFNPGCALSIYKPDMENRILKFLNENYGDVKLHKICCQHDPQVYDTVQWHEQLQEYIEVH